MWLGIAIVAGLIVWAVGGLIALNPLPWHIRKYWDVPGEKELHIIQAIALLLIVAGVTIFFMTESGTFWHDLWPEMISTGGAILGIDELNRRRSAQEYKQGIIRQMASRSNDFALEAARIANGEGWLKDGTFSGANLLGANLAGINLVEANLKNVDLKFANLERADLFLANLRGADLGGANLKWAKPWCANFEGAFLFLADLTGASLLMANLAGANLVGANLEGADLLEASFMGANLGEANLKGADLGKANLTEVNLRGANLSEALYDHNTRWPDDFDPKLVGAVNGDELNEKEWEEWRKAHRHREVKG